uniref:SMODS domain-containing nucleotidyltransferase n=1 Tax=uncultured Erythrobacter sp. TaxID=263913 RepID=UPI00260EB610|nr:nucleotidyltransferase [uncultured Erythrobacter sp.]
MKLINHFNNFLKDTVDLNKTRIDTLESSVESIKEIIKTSDWEPRVWRFVDQGSWAHQTIIKPVEEHEFDADLLVVVAKVEDWRPKDYINSLYDIFSENGNYKSKVRRWSHCVTITYAGQRKIDIAPCVKNRIEEPSMEVCNRSADMFETTAPEEYTAWIKRQNGYSKNNSFRKVTRIVKYMRDITGKFVCPSVVLTTILADRIFWYDEDLATFSDVPTALQTIFARLDDWLQQHHTKPKICNPTYQAENFSDLLTDIQYSNLRSAVNDLRKKIDDAYAEPDREQSISKWKKVLGDKFAQGANVLAKAELTEDTSSFDALIREDAHHDNKVVDLIKSAGAWLWTPDLDSPSHMVEPVWKRADFVSDKIKVLAKWSEQQHSPTSRIIADFEALPPKGGVRFDVRQHDGSEIPSGFFVRWRITNTGMIAMALGKGRGRVYSPSNGHQRWEPLAYRGVHLAEAFVVQHSTNEIVAQSAPFHVVIQ